MITFRAIETYIIPMKPTSIHRLVFRSGYFEWKHLIAQGLISALVTVFYSTNQSFFISLHNPAHLILFFFSFLLMCIIAWICGWISTRLDQYFPWYQNFLLRQIMQFLFGVVLVSIITLQVVYFVYEILFAINLRDTEYFSRDFTIVMACVVCMNFHHHNLLLRSMIRLFRHPDHSSNLPIADRVSQQEIEFQFPVLDQNRCLPAIRIAAFCLNPVKGNTNFIEMVDSLGQRYILQDIETLAWIEEQCPYLFIKVSRYYLINRYELPDATLQSEPHYELQLRIPGMSPIRISRDKHHELSLLFAPKEL